MSNLVLPFLLGYVAPNTLTLSHGGTSYPYPLVHFIVARVYFMPVRMFVLIETITSNILEV